MSAFCLTIDDNIRFLKELSTGKYISIFDHPYLAVFRRLHRIYGIKVQLNLFFKTDGFTLAEMTDRFKEEWEENSDWLKLSFHSSCEEKCGYENADYDEVFEDASNVNREIVRFAGKASLATSTTIHYCRCSAAGLKALCDCGYCRLLGLYGTDTAPFSSYGLTPDKAAVCRKGVTLLTGGFIHMPIDAILDKIKKEEVISVLEPMIFRDTVRIMTHEQYFYEDYVNYQSDYLKKLEIAVRFLSDMGFYSAFVEEILI